MPRAVAVGQHNNGSTGFDPVAPSGTMERYLDDQFHWSVHAGLPPGTPPRTMTNPYKVSPKYERAVSERMRHFSPIREIHLGIAE